MTDCIKFFEIIRISASFLKHENRQMLRAFQIKYNYKHPQRCFCKMYSFTIYTSNYNLNIW